jgi:glycosyltransferase involved in cell wall biosynthesis
MGQYASHLLTGVAEDDIDVVAYGAPGEPRPAWLPERVVWRAPQSRAPRKIAAISSRVLSLSQSIISDRIDVFHTPGVHVRPSLPPAPTVPCPLIVTVHDLIPIHHYGRSLARRLRWFYRWNLRRALRATKIITVSSATRDDIASYTGRDPSTISVIPNGVDFAPETDHVRLAGRSIRSPYILYAGAYEPRKNLAGAFAAYLQLVARGSDYQLVAIVDAGSGHAQPLRRMADTPPLRGRVHLVEAVPERELRSLYTHASALLFPSFAEGFGLPPLQAAACGVPVVAADLPAIRETMAGAALLVSPDDPTAMADALEQVLQDHATRLRLIEHGRDRASAYTWERALVAHIAIYREMSANPRTGS